MNSQKLINEETMHEIHPEVLNFVHYCQLNNIDVRRLAQQYADENPLSYGDYLLLGFFAQEVRDRAVDVYEWGISERPDTVINICEYVQGHHDSDTGTTWHEIDEAIKEVFKVAPPEVKALAEGSRLKTWEEIVNRD